MTSTVLNAETHAADCGQWQEPRARALADWRSRRDPEDRIDPSVLHGAAKIAPLVQTEHGPMFDPTSFGELVEFIAEMPF